MTKKKTGKLESWHLSDSRHIPGSNQHCSQDKLPNSLWEFLQGPENFRERANASEVVGESSNGRKRLLDFEDSL